MEAKQALELLAEVLQTRAAHFRNQERYGIALVEGGRFVLDPAGRDVLIETWSDDVSVRIYTNAKTLSDMANGKFDPDHPQPGHVFLVDGDLEALGTLGRALGFGRSVVDVRSGDS